MTTLEYARTQLESLRAQAAAMTATLDALLETLRPDPPEEAPAPRAHYFGADDSTQGQG
jgi:hypothetical protein